MNLRELHSPAPLRDADYAAVRARVLADIHASRRRWRWTLALASAAMIAIALWLQMPAPQPKKHASPWTSAVSTPVRRVAPPTSAASGAAAESTALHFPAQHTEPARPIATKPPEPLRIELHTSDPDIRIICIVNPKEES